MSDEATEEKKGKKKKEKKPKKEKPPKEKKPKKEKKAKGGDASEGEEGAKKKKGPPLLILILVPVFVVLIGGVLWFVILPRLSGGSADAETEITEESPDALSGQMEKVEKAKGGKKSADADAESDAGEESAESGEDAESDGEEAPEEGADAESGDGEASDAPPKSEPVEMAVSMTRGEALDYFRSMPPSALGLSGESMDEYDIFPSENLVTVDGVPCREFRVYSVSGRAGTNDVQGLYLLTQSGARKLYRLDRSANSVTEIKWTPPKPTPVPEELEGEADVDSEETP